LNMAEGFVSARIDRAQLRPTPTAAPQPPLHSPRLLDRVRERVRLLHYSRRTEEAYVHWSRAFIRFHGLRHPQELGGAEVEAFLSWLAGERQVSASTHKQALSALLFLYGRVLGMNLPWMLEIGRPRVHRRLPVVLTRQQLTAVFAHLEGSHRLLAQLLYGTGMRISEALHLTSTSGRSSCAPARAGRIVR
jgi:integrase